MFRPSRAYGFHAVLSACVFLLLGGQDKLRQPHRGQHMFLKEHCTHIVYHHTHTILSNRLAYRF